MTFRGTIQDGKVILDPGASLPNGTRVDVQPAKPARRAARAPSPRRAARRATRAKTSSKPSELLSLTRYAVSTGIRDLAQEHDHYIYGTPKRAPRRRPARRN